MVAYAAVPNIVAIIKTVRWRRIIGVEFTYQAA